MRTNGLFDASSRIAQRGQQLASVVIRSVATAVIATVCLAAANTAHAVVWTAGEIVQAIQQAQANGQPFDRLLAQKVQEELAKANFQIIDDRLVYTTTIPAEYVNLGDALDQTDAKGAFKTFLTTTSLAYGLGVCDVPIPEGTLNAARSSITDVSAKFSNTGTYIDFRTNPGQVILTLGINAQTNITTNLGLEWCGIVAWPVSCQQWVPNPGCPPCPPKGPCPPCPLPDICLVPGLPRIEKERWTDWARADVFGQLKGQMSLTLNHSFSVANNTITVGLNAVLAGQATQVPNAVLGPVVPDFRLINVPVPPFQIPHVDKSPFFQVLGTQTNGLVFALKALGQDDNKINSYVVSPLVAQQQARLNAIINSYFPVQLQLPSVQDFANLDPVTQALVRWVLDYLRDNLDVIGEFALEVVRNNWTEVLYYILTDNREALVQLFAYQAVCPSLEQLKTSMPVSPLYSTSSGACAAIDPRVATNSGPYYSSASCQTEIAFQREDFARFCREALTPKPNPLLGNAAAWPSLGLESDPVPTPAGPSTKWSLSTGAQLAVGVESIRQNYAPYIKRVNYRQVGNCALEMRVFKKDVGATNLTPLLWIHGGAWTYRSSGSLGLESLVSSYTEDGFVVFAPFYRLAGDKDGNQECRNTSLPDMESDIAAALDWVKANGTAFGAGDTTKIAVTGQSAGAHLAGWLMTHRPNDISRGMLVYPPTDLRDFLSRLQGVNGASFPPLSDAANTPYDASSAQEIIETLLQLPLGSARTTSLGSAVVADNSFADIVRTNPSGFPPAFILHGTRDSLLTYSQSEVLCEGYGGAVNVDWSATQDLRAIYPCGNRSQLHLFREADHAFEVCPSPAIPSACRAGSAASASLLTDSLRQGRQWLNTRTLRNGVPINGLSGATADELTYVIDVPAGVYNLTFQINGGVGDADLYVRYGAPPTTTAYDCRPYIDGNDEICPMPATAGTWYVTVRGYTDFADVSLVASYTGTANYLQNGVPVTGLTGASGALVSYLFQVPAGFSNVSFQLSGGVGDADLYVRYGAPPTTTAYDCRPYIDGNNEICTKSAIPGTWYVMVYGYAAFSGVTLRANYQ